MYGGMILPWIQHASRPPLQWCIYCVGRRTVGHLPPGRSLLAHFPACFECLGHPRNLQRDIEYMRIEKKNYKQFIIMLYKR